MNPKKKAIVEKGLLTEDELSARISEIMEKGDARNENSAVMKIYRDVSIQDDGVQDVSGFWLQAYQRNDGTVSGYMLTEKGPIRVGNLQEAPQPPEPFKMLVPVKFTGVSKKKNVFTGSEWLESSKETRAEPTELSYKFSDCVQKITDVKESGMYVIGGHVRWTNTVGEFRDGEKVGDFPILDNGKVNLRIVIEDEDGHQLKVKIPDENRLSMLLEGEDFAWLTEPDSIKELGDMLAFEELVVFGQMSRKFSEGRKDERELDNPYANLSNFGFVILNPVE